MDGLALLCNLHADGPLTLRRLREAGVRGLRDLDSIPETTLAVWLRASAAQARRFVEEGRQLVLRIAEEPLETETPAGTEESRESSVTPLREPIRSWISSRPALPPVDPPRTAVFERAAAPPLSSPAVSSMVRGYEPEETSLVAGRIDGLDGRTCQRLIEQGVRTVQALVELAGLPLARRTGIPYTKLLDLAYRARRSVSESLPRRGAPEPARALETVEIGPEPARGLRSLEGLSLAPVRPANPFRPPPGTRAREATSPARARVGFPEDPGSAGPFV